MVESAHFVYVQYTQSTSLDLLTDRPDTLLQRIQRLDMVFTLLHQYTIPFPQSSIEPIVSIRPIPRANGTDGRPEWNISVPAVKLAGKLSTR